jgi:hypothetical protein
VLILADTIWLFVMFPHWYHNDDAKSYWNSLSGIHLMAKILAILELVLKGLTVAYLFTDYRQKNNNDISNGYYIII